MELEFRQALMIALLNEEEGKTAAELSPVMGRNKQSISQDLKELRQHGYVVAEEERQESGHTALRYRIKPMAYNEANEVLEKYWDLTTKAIQLMQEFNGYRAEE